MRKVKVLLSISAIVVLALTMVSCGKPYNNVKFDDYIKVGNYKGLDVLPFEVTVTDEEVAKKIQTNLEAAAEQKNVKEGTVANGDNVTITYKGTIDGKAFEGGSAEGYSLTIGSGQFIPGFEAGLVGVKVGESKVLDLKFPKDYKEKKLADKDVKFTVTVNSKNIKVVPQLDEAFVKKHSKAKTVEDYKKYVKTELLNSKKLEGKKVQKSQLWGKIVSSSTVVKGKDGKEKYPEDQVKRVYESVVDQYKKYAKQAGLDFKAFLKQQMNMDEKTFEKQATEYSKLIVKEELILYYIVDKEKIKFSSKEYNEFIDRTLKAFGYDSKSYKEANGESYEKSIGKEKIERQLYMEKALDLVLKQGKIVKPKS